MRRKGISFSTITIIIIVVCVLFFLGVKVLRIDNDEKKYMEYVAKVQDAISVYSQKYLDNGDHKLVFDDLKKELISNQFLVEYDDPAVVISADDIVLTKENKKIEYYNYSNTTTFENRFEIKFIKDEKTFVCTKTECR